MRGNPWKGAFRVCHPERSEFAARGNAARLLPGGVSRTGLRDHELFRPLLIGGAPPLSSGILRPNPVVEDETAPLYEVVDQVHRNEKAVGEERDLAHCFELEVTGRSCGQIPSENLETRIARHGR